MPRSTWRHLRMTNVVESLCCPTTAVDDTDKRFKKAERATAVIWKMLMVVPKRFQRFSVSELLAQACTETIGAAVGCTL